MLRMVKTKNREERAPINTVIHGDHGVDEDKEMQIPVNTEVVIIGHFEDPYKENKTPLNAVLVRLGVVEWKRTVGV